jgi:hypothetical protein
MTVAVLALPAAAAPPAGSRLLANGSTVGPRWYHF